VHQKGTKVPEGILLATSSTVRVPRFTNLTASLLNSSVYFLRFFIGPVPRRPERATRIASFAFIATIVRRPWLGANAPRSTVRAQNCIDQARELFAATCGE